MNGEIIFVSTLNISWYLLSIFWFIKCIIPDFLLNGGQRFKARKRKNVKQKVCISFSPKKSIFSSYMYFKYQLCCYKSISLLCVSVILVADAARCLITIPIIGVDVIYNWLCVGVMFQCKLSDRTLGSGYICGFILKSIINNQPGNSVTNLLKRAYTLILHK